DQGREAQDAAQDHGAEERTPLKSAACGLATVAKPQAARSSDHPLPRTRYMARNNGPLLAAAALALALAPTVRAAEDFDELQEKAVKAAVRQVAPCVVQIETSGGTDVVVAGPRGLLRRGTGPTSGLVVGADGYIISSAFNFANKPSQIRVSVPGLKERRVAKVVATDQTRMLTLLKIDLNAGEKLPVPVPSPKAEFKVGQTAIAVGRTLAA